MSKETASPYIEPKNDIRFFAGPILDLSRIDISEALQKMGITLDTTEEELIKTVEEIKNDPEKLAILSGVIEKAAAKLQNNPEHLAERTRAALNSTIRFLHTKSTGEESETESAHETPEGIINRIMETVAGPFVDKAIYNISFQEQFRRWRKRRKKDSQ